MRPCRRETHLYCTLTLSRSLCRWTLSHLVEIQIIIHNTTPVTRTHTHTVTNSRNNSHDDGRRPAAPVFSSDAGRHLSAEYSVAALVDGRGVVDGRRLLGVVSAAALVSAAAVEVIAGTLGLGDAASEAVGLGREDEAAARGAVPVARPAGRGAALAEAAAAAAAIVPAAAEAAAAAAAVAAEAAVAALLVVLWRSGRGRRFGQLVDGRRLDVFSAFPSAGP